MKQALLYVRVSTERQEEEGFSLAAQEKQGLAYAEKNGLKVVRTWKGSESAWKKERVSFNLMIDYAKKHPEIDHVIFDILDRMTRNDFDKLKIVDLVHKYGKTIHFARSNKIYSKDSSPDDEFMLDIEVAVAKKMSNDISRKTKMGMSEKAAQGIFPHCAPIGYKNDLLARNVVVDPINASLIQGLFEKAASGSYSLLMLEDILYREGLRHPQRGSKVRKSTLYRTITNTMYYGVFVWGKKSYQGTHTPLVSRELWNAANAALKKFHRPHITKHNFAFGNLLTCGTCDCTILGEVQKGKYTYYRCSFSKGQHKHEGYLREEVLAELFAPLVEAITIPEELGECLKKGLKEKLGRLAKLTKSKQENLQLEYDKTFGKLKRLYDLQLEGNINQEIFAAKETELNDTLATVKSQLEACKKDPKEVLKEVDDSLALLTSLFPLYQQADNEEKAKILKLVGQDYVLQGKEIKPTYRPIFNILAENREKICPTYLLSRAESSRDVIWGG